MSARISPTPNSRNSTVLLRSVVHPFPLTLSTFLSSNSPFTFLLQATLLREFQSGLLLMCCKCVVNVLFPASPSFSISVYYAVDILCRGVVECSTLKAFLLGLSLIP
eukprot:RCo030406